MNNKIEENFIHMLEAFELESKEARQQMIEGHISMEEAQDKITQFMFRYDDETYELKDVTK